MRAACQQSDIRNGTERFDAIMAPRQTLPKWKVYCRCRRQRPRYFILAIVLCFFSTIWTAHGGGFDPFTTLGVSRTASPEEIKKRYRKLCLKYHPDKNGGKSETERELCENKFKQVQAAFEMIENKKFGGGPTPFTSRQSNNPFGSDPRSFPRSNFSRQRQRQGPFEDDTFNFFFCFATNGHAQTFSSFHRNLSFREQFWKESMNVFHQLLEDDVFKSIYVQSVKIPLEDLYKGTPSFQFELKDNLFKRYCASIRGKMIFYSAFMSLIFSVVFMPGPIRHSKIGHFIMLYMIHATTPAPDPLASYIQPIKKGTRGGKATVNFSTTKQLEIRFEIEEAGHPVYRREGNDLHAEVVITRKEAKKGCKKILEALDPSQEALKITIPPKKYRYMSRREYREMNPDKNSFTIPGRGWPIPTEIESGTELEAEEYDYGDLIVRIRVVQKPSVRKKRLEDFFLGLFLRSPLRK